MIKLSQRTPTTCASQVASCQNRWLVVVLLSIVLLFMCPAVFARSLSILLMPIESADTTELEPFNESKNPYDRLKFDNTETDWMKLEIGYQHWLCGELQKFAQKEKLDEIIVRFISWDQAHHEIDSLGKAFDLIQVPSTWTAYLIDQGLLAKWDGDVNLQEFAPKLLNTCRIEGHKDIHALPWQLDVRVLFYRQELTDDPNRLLTFEDFRKCLDDRKKQMNSSPDPVWKSPFCIARDRDWDILHNTLRYFWNGKIIEEYLWFWWRPAFDSDDGMEGIAKLHDMAKKDLVYFPSLAEANGKQGWYGLANGLLDGKFDAVFGGIYMRTVFDRRPDVKILAAPLPQLIPGQKKTFLGGSHLAVTTAAPRPYARSARKLIQRLTSEQSGIAMFNHTNAIPANKEALKEFFKSRPRWQSLGLDKLMESAEAYPSIPQWAELETDVVLGNLHTILRGIASGQSQQKIEFHVQNAAKKVREIVGPPWWVIFLGVLLGVSLAFSVYLLISKIIQRWRYQKILEKLVNELDVMVKAVHDAEQKTTTAVEKSHKGLRNVIETSTETIRKDIRKDIGILKGHIDQITPKLQGAIEGAKHELLAEQKGSHQQLSKDFKSVKDALEQLEEVAHSLFSDTAQQEDNLQNLVIKMDGALLTLNELRTSTDQTIGSLNGVIKWGEDLRAKIGVIYKKVVPYSDNKLGECEIRADFGYENGKVTLELSALFHTGNRIGNSRTNWPERFARFFELLMMRTIMQGEPKGTRLSDYILICQDVPTSKDPVDTAQHFVRQFRTEIYSFVSLKCAMIDPDGHTIKPKDFMLQHIGPLRKGKRKGYYDTKDYTKKTRETTGRSKLEYKFILGDQVATLRSNMFRSLKELREENLTPNNICVVLHKHPRCLPGWMLLTKYRLPDLSPENKEFVYRNKQMLLDEARRYSWAAKILGKSFVKTIVREAFREDLKEVREGFQKWAKTWKYVATKFTKKSLNMTRMSSASQWTK